MRDIGAKVLANDDVPCRAVAFVKLLLDLGGDVLLDVVLFERGGGDVDGLLLHLLAHVDVLDDRLRARAVGVLGERARVGARGRVDLVFSCPSGPTGLLAGSSHAAACFARLSGIRPP